MLNKIILKTYRHLKNIFLTHCANYLDRKEVDNFYRMSNALGCEKNNQVILLDGLWDNPNHFFRLNIFLASIDVRRQSKRIAIIRENTSSAVIRTLQTLGVVEFFKIPNDVSENFTSAAQEILLEVKSHEDFLKIKLPNELPAYVVYDYVLKKMRHPHPPIDDLCWRDAVAYALMVNSCLSNFFSAIKVDCVVLSHPWGLPYGYIAWSSINRSINTYHLTGYGGGIRIRFFKSRDDFSLPVEHLSYKEFEELPPYLKADLSKVGQLEFDKRLAGLSSDINVRYAYKPKDRQKVDQIKDKLGVKGNVKVVLVCAHVWFDYPHTFGMSNFVDFHDWITFTVDIIKNLKDIIWLMKPHPTETWYGGFQLASLLKGDYCNLILLPQDFDQATAISVADAVVTVHGTVGLEAAINNIPVICADKGYYSDWPFVRSAISREDYRHLLMDIAQVFTTKVDNKDLATACFGAALAQPNQIDQRMAVNCDSMGVQLYKDIVMFHKFKSGLVVDESKLISDWLSSGSSSYAVYALLKGLSSVYDSK